MNAEPQNTSKHSIESAELKKFSAIANQWWDKTGACQPLHAINPIRLDFIDKNCHLNKKTVLDVGCGGGILSESMANLGATVTGIDLNSELIEVAKLHLYESKLDVSYHATRVEKFAETHLKNYDVVTCMELLEHVPDPEEIIKSCSEMTKNNGFVFFSTINRNLSSYLKAVLAAEYILQLLPKGTHDYDKFIKPSELCRLARRHSLELVEFAGFDYNLFKQSYFATKNINVNYMGCFKKIC